MIIPIGASIDRKTGAITPWHKEATTEEAIGYIEMLNRVATVTERVLNEKKQSNAIPQTV